MIEALQANQCAILVAMSFSCLLLAGYAGVVKSPIARFKSSLLLLEVGVGLLLLFDALSYAFRGDCSAVGSVLVRVSNAMTFVMTCLNPFLLSRYAGVIIMDAIEARKAPRLIRISAAVALVGVALVVVSQYTGAYYTIGEDSLYRRGPFFTVSLVAPFLSVLFVAVAVWQHRRDLSRRVLLVFMLYCALPVVAATAQAFLYGISLTSFAAWFSATVLFGVALLEQSERLSVAACTDSATGLPNAYGYEDAVRRIMATRDISGYCALRIEMCRLSSFNNELGKTAYDELVRRYAYELRRHLGEGEVLGKVGNYFDALVKKEHVDAFLTLLDGLPIKVVSGGKPVTVNVSSRSGAYLIGDSSLTVAQITELAASAAAYASLGTRGAHVTMDEGLAQEMRERQNMEEEIARALEDREFEPFYQPKVDASTGMLCGSEALVRWRHGGVIVPPYRFIPVMEANGSICRIDYLMLEKVCEDLRGWLDAGMEPVAVSVNFSRRHLGSADTAQRIYDTLERYSVPASLVQIEVTETIDDYPLSDLVAFVSELHRLGFDVAIDDFGTGSSSVSLLKFADFDVLKIGRSLTAFKNHKEESILRSIIAMATEIGVEVVAEGVEERDQVVQLMGMGCCVIQGYYYDMPLEKVAYEGRLANKRYLG